MPNATVPNDDALTAVCLTEKELALRWRVSLRTLQRWRRSGLAPAHLEIGRSVLYRRVDVVAFETSRVRPTGDQ